MKFLVRYEKLAGIPADAVSVEAKMLAAMRAVESIGYKPTWLRISPAVALSLSGCDSEGYRMLVAGKAQFAGIPLEMIDDCHGDEIEVTAEEAPGSEPPNTRSSTIRTA